MGSLHSFHRLRRARLGVLVVAGLAVLGSCESPLESSSVVGSYTPSGALQLLHIDVEPGNDTVEFYQGADTLVLFSDGTGEFRGSAFFRIHRLRPELNDTVSAYWPFIWTVGPHESSFGQAVWVRAAPCGTRGCGPYNGAFSMRIVDGPELVYQLGRSYYRLIGPPSP